MSATGTTDIWASGEAYEAYVGRWSRLVAHEFLRWLSAPPDLVWLDVGCGTGALAHTILETTSPHFIIGVDQSARFIDYAQSQLGPRVFGGTVHSAQNLGLKQESLDYVVSGLVLNFVPEPQRAVTEMARVAKGGGCVAAYVWVYGEMQLMQYFWNAARQIDPSARDLDESVRFQMAKPEYLQYLFQSAGLTDIVTQLIDVPTVFADFDDYWSPFLAGQGPAPAYAAAQSEERRSALRERIRSRLPVAADGSIHLSARACAVRGTR